MLPNRAENISKQLNSTADIFFPIVFQPLVGYLHEHFRFINFHIHYHHDWQKHCGIYDAIRGEQKKSNRTIHTSPHTFVATVRYKYL